MGKWNFGWLSPWAYALAHAIKVRDELTRETRKGNESAGKLLDGVLDVLVRYNTGERSLKIYSDMFALSLRGIKKYVK